MHDKYTQVRLTEEERTKLRYTAKLHNNMNLSDYIRVQLGFYPIRKGATIRAIKTIKAGEVVEKSNLTK